MSLNVSKGLFCSLLVGSLVMVLYVFVSASKDLALSMQSSLSMTTMATPCLLSRLGPLASSASCTGVRGVVDRLMPHLFLVKGAVCGGNRYVGRSGCGCWCCGCHECYGCSGCTSGNTVFLFVDIVGCPPKNVCLPKVPKLWCYPLHFLSNLSKFINLLPFNFAVPVFLFCL